MPLHSRKQYGTGHSKNTSDIMGLLCIVLESCIVYFIEFTIYLLFTLLFHYLFSTIMIYITIKFCKIYLLYSIFNTYLLLYMYLCSDFHSIYLLYNLYMACNYEFNYRRRKRGFKWNIYICSYLNDVNENIFEYIEFTIPN